MHHDIFSCHQTFLFKLLATGVYNAVWGHQTFGQQPAPTNAYSNPNIAQNLLPKRLYTSPFPSSPNSLIHMFNILGYIVRLQYIIWNCFLYVCMYVWYVH